jgi:homoserine dehydrogenase
MANGTLTIGTFGNGCVGQGFLHLLRSDPTSQAQVKHVCVKRRDVARDIGPAKLTWNALDILGDDQVGAIVELTNDPELALDVIRRALRSGRNAITASKRVVAEHLAELIALQRSTGRALLYEAACAASIPVVRTLETHFAGEEVQRIDGILNGTTNYILTLAEEEGLAPEEALRRAQDEGFAESDPTADISGADARYKLVILIAHAFGTVLRPDAVLRHGVEELHAEDLAFGARHGWRIRSVASAWRNAQGQLAACVLPRFVPQGDPLAAVRHEYNAVLIEGRWSGTHLLQGKGAGRLPTGLAVLSDVQQLTRGGGYAYAKVNHLAPTMSAGQETIAVYARIPATHQEALARFNTLHTVDTEHGRTVVTGEIGLHELRALLGEGREGFQCIALPHLRIPNTDREP